MKKLLVIAVLGLLYLFGCCDSFAEQLRDGDIIFQTSQSEQSIAIQKATRSQYSHMGIVFFRNGSPHVYEAIQTVQYTHYMLVQIKTLTAEPLRTRRIYFLFGGEYRQTKTCSCRAIGVSRAFARRENSSDLLTKG